MMSPLGWRLVAILAIVTATNAIRPSASYRTLELGGSATVVGLVTATYAAPSVLAALPLGRLIDRTGTTRYLLIGILVHLTGTILDACSGTVIALMAGQALNGLGHISFVLAVQTMAARSTARDRQFTIQTIAVSAGYLAGPLLAGTLIELEMAFLGSVRTTTAAFLGAIAVTLLGLIAAWNATRDVHTGSNGHLVESRGLRPLRTVFGQAGMSRAVGTGVAVAAAADLLIAYLPVLGEAKAISPGAVGVVLGLRAAGSLSSRLALAAAQARITDRRRILLSSMILPAAAVLALPMADGAWFMGSLMFAAGFGLGIGEPLTLAWVAGLSPPEIRGTAMALRMTANRGGQMLLPAAAGVLAALLGTGTVFAFTGAALFSGSLFVFTAHPDLVERRHEPSHEAD